jgi:hypothetical protein
MLTRVGLWVMGVMVIVLLDAGNIMAQTVVFDDFSYTGADDPVLGSFNQWSVVNGTNGPPSGANYLKSNVTFTDDGLMQLRCANSGTVSSATHARLESREVVYFEGTYAARVYFDDSPHDFQDPVIQTFYAISPSSGGQNPTTYAEVDFEYLPWDAWNGLYNNNYAHAMWMSSYESARVLPGGLDNDHQFIKQSMGGAWHTLLFRFTDGAHVEYFIDGVLKATLSTRAGDGVSVYPDYNMLVSFANWGYPPIEGTSFGGSASARSSTMQVDWFVYVAGQSKTNAEIETMVENFRAEGVSRKNRLGQTQGPGVTTSIEPGVQRLALHPNPAGEKVFVDAAPGNPVVIHDVMGRTVLAGYVGSDEGIDISALRGGVYTARLAMANGAWLWARFVKQ